VKSEDISEEEIEIMKSNIAGDDKCIRILNEKGEKDYEKIKNRMVKNYWWRMGNVYGNEVKKKTYNQICTPIYKNGECIIKSDCISKGGKNVT